MRPKGTSSELRVRREIAHRMLADGKSVTEVAHAVGVSRQSVHNWRLEFARDKGVWTPPPHTGGFKPRLNEKQIKQLERLLDQGAPKHGFVGDYWTGGRIGEVIWKHFKVRYHPDSVSRMLRKAGWSWQKPQRVPLQRDDEAVTYWARRVVPRIKKVS